MKIRLLLLTIGTALLFSSLMSGTVFAAESDQTTNKEVCGFEIPNEKIYDAEIIAVRKKFRVEPGEVFRTKVFLKNSGNMPWFSENSECLGPRMYLGSDNLRDRNSSLYTPQIEGIENTNWKAPNRIIMDQNRIDPGEIASFTFWSKAPNRPDVLKEYFAPVLTAVQWIDDAQFSFELMVGDTGETSDNLRKRFLYAGTSGSIMDINLNGEKVIVMDLSEQQMYLKLDDRVIRIFPISSGKASTPTPIGTTYILLKQEVRVAHKSPHYIMPKFMMFRAGGYGIHALPSLGGDGGWFWTEARNHIGIPVSHGCVRLLPEDADFAYEFADVGTTVITQW